MQTINEGEVVNILCSDGQTYQGTISVEPQSDNRPPIIKLIMVTPIGTITVPPKIKPTAP